MAASRELHETVWNIIRERCGHDGPTICSYCEVTFARLIAALTRTIAPSCRECLQHPERAPREARLCLTCAEDLFGSEDTEGGCRCGKCGVVVTCNPPEWPIFDGEEA